MGKIKGWKKTIEMNGIIQYDSEYSNNEIAITNFDFKGGEWVVILKRNGEDVKNLFFGTKKQALDYAMKYMRSPSKKVKVKMYGEWTTYPNIESAKRDMERGMAGTDSNSSEHSRFVKAYIQLNKGLTTVSGDY